MLLPFPSICLARGDDPHDGATPCVNNYKKTARHATVEPETSLAIVPPVVLLHPPVRIEERR